MAVSVVMPALEMAQETGKLISWLKKEGDAIAKGEPLLEIETDKAVLELEAPGDGVLAGVTAQRATWFRWARPSRGSSRRARSRRWKRNPPRPPREPMTGASRGTRRIAAPPARRRETSTSRSRPKRAAWRRSWASISAKFAERARAETISGEDVRARGGPQKASPTPRRSQRFPSRQLSSIARLMAERTTQSWTTAPHFFLVREIDASGLIAAREKHGKAIYAYRSSGRARGAGAGEASQDERELDRRRDPAQSEREHQHRDRGEGRRGGRRDSERRSARRSPTSAPGASDLAERAARAAFIRPTSPAARSPSAISACSAWTLSARSSRRRKPRFWLSAASPIAWCR